jgi:hypothetical protein
VNRTRHVFLYSAWVPPALWVATLLYVRRFEGWGAWAAAPLLLPSFALSLVWACAGLLLLVRTGVQNRRPDYAVLAATLVSGAAALYYVGRALLLSIG